MNSKSKRTLGLAAIALIFLVGVGWLSRDRSDVQITQTLPAVSRLIRSGPPQPPPAPEQETWLSPLSRRCQPGDQNLRQSLLQRLQRLRQNRVTVSIDPSNHGDRFRRDAYGRPTDPQPRLIVLHETVYGIGSAINTFVTPHPRDEDQVSYHALIGQDGTVVQVLDPARRAFGAGNSAFNGHWVVTNPAVGGSVNNFALHVSLETPLDGEDNEAAHSGYTSKQYDALAVLLADWMGVHRIPFDNITTHRYVDLGGERSDPRSFDWQLLEQRLQALGMLCNGRDAQALRPVRSKGS